MQLDRRGVLFLTLSGLFITALVVGDLIGGKLMGVSVPLFAPQKLSAGFLVFPLTFLLTDLINEYYGKRAARILTFVGLAMAVFTLVVLTVAVATPWHPVTQAPGWGGLKRAPYDAVFASGQRILMASMVAYVVAQLIDIAIFQWLKRKTGERFLWLRATGSTIGSQLIDTLIIQSLVWDSTLSGPEVQELIISTLLGKVAIALLLTPVLYAGHAVVERVLKIEPVAAGM